MRFNDLENYCRHIDIAETVPLLAPLEAFGICLRFHRLLRSQPAAQRRVIAEEFQRHMCHFFDFFSSGTP
jgi:hypothetical protein